LIVDGSSRGYLRKVGDYVHLNPVRAKLLKAEQPLKAYRWSSYPEYLKGASRRVKWLRVDRLLGEAGIPRDSRAGRRQFELRMEEIRQQTDAEQWRQVRQGWYLGDEEFRAELLRQVQEKVGPNHYGRERGEAAESKAKRIVQEELTRLGWSEGELQRRRKGDVEKIRIARRIRRETTMSLKWIAASLAMGTWTYVANCLCQA
jgi:hypothetical protein